METAGGQDRLRSAGARRAGPRNEGGRPDHLPCSLGEAPPAPATSRALEHPCHERSIPLRSQQALGCL